MTTSQPKLTPHEYAAEVRARPVPCQCEACVKAEMLPAVIRIVQNFHLKGNRNGE